MATDYDAPRKTDDELSEDSIELVKVFVSRRVVEGLDAPLVKECRVFIYRRPEGWVDLLFELVQILQPAPLELLEPLLEMRLNPLLEPSLVFRRYVTPCGRASLRRGRGGMDIILEEGVPEARREVVVPVSGGLGRSVPTNWARTRIPFGARVSWLWKDRPKCGLALTGRFADVSVGDRCA